MAIINTLGNSRRSDGEGFARSGDAQQHLIAKAVPDALDQSLDRRRLVSGRDVVRCQLESLQTRTSRSVVRPAGPSRIVATNVIWTPNVAGTILKQEGPGGVQHGAGVRGCCGRLG